MKIHFLLHKEYDSSSAIVAWAETNGYTCHRTYIAAGETPPSLDEFDVLISLGGPQHIYNISDKQWVQDEISLIKKAIAAKKKVFGICLGGQFIAAALGAVVCENHTSEIGWWDVERLSNTPITKGLPNSFTTFHWHTDMFNLPKGAVTIFRNAATPHQGFTYNDNVVALQFHPEITDAGLDFLDEFLETEGTGEWIQTRNQLRNGSKHTSKNHEYLHQMLNNLVNA